MANDPSFSSYYVGDEFYQALVDNFTDWQTHDAEITDVALLDSCRRLQPQLVLCSHRETGR